MTDWGQGSYELTASQLAPIADQVVDAVEPVSGLRLLDIACGTGNAALVAADRGASVVGLDGAPRLLAVAAERARQNSLDLDLVESDIYELPFPENSFEAVTSVFGTIFGDPARTATEIARVLTAPGRIAIASWTREGPMERLGALAKEHVTEAVGQASGDVPLDDSLDWGGPDALRELFGEHGIAVQCERHRIAFVTASPEAQNDEWFDHHPIWLGMKRVIGEERYEDLRAESLGLLHEINEDASAMRFTSTWILTVGSPV